MNIDKTLSARALPAARTRPRVNPRLLNLSRAIHIYLSVALLLVLLFFALTGITLNHAERFAGAPRSESRALDALPELPRDAEGRISASPELGDFLGREFGIRLSHAQLRYEDEFLLVDYQVPGAATLVEIDQDFGEAYMEHTDYGLIAALNDLHKGRHTDVLWSLLLDLSAVLLVLFALAGFVLLIPSKRRFTRVMKYSVIGLSALTAGYLLLH